MNRRTAMLTTMLLGGWLPRGVLAQGVRRKASSTGRPRPGAGDLNEPEQRPKRIAAADEAEPGSTTPAEPADAGSNDPVPNMPAEPGQQWRTFDISRYTTLDHSQPNPQNAIVEWIFLRTGTSAWYGDKISVLSAGKTRIRAYNDAKHLDQAAEVIERFTDAVTDFLSLRVRFVAAVDTRWRYAVYSRLTPVGSGPQGQQIWTLKAEDAAFVLAQMQIYQGFRLLTDQKVEMVNGQTLRVKTSEPRGYTGSMARESAVGLGYQPKAEQLEEHVNLRLSPLLTYDGDAVDASIDLTVNTVKSLHRTKVIAPRDVGPSELSIDVPEVVESHITQTVKGWPLGQTLLISAGIHPGILQSKGGLFNLRIPGTVPTGTEVLVFLDAEAAARPKRTASRNRDEE